MIIVNILGGLGNQMFTYACGRRLAEKHHTELLLNLSSFNNYKWPYALDKFNIRAQINDRINTRLFEIGGRITNRLLGRKTMVSVNGIKPVWEYKAAFNPEIIDLHDKVFLDGYWASEKYFKDIADVLRNEFTLREAISRNTMLWEDKIKSEEMPISLHIRRGDYLESDINRQIYAQVPVSYYYNGIELIRKNADISALFVFSNDIDWCKETFKFDIPVYYVTGNDEFHGYEDMYLMSLCKHNIVANSTFSWWGAWLNRYKEKVVICPKKFFNISDIWHDSTDTWPEEWIQL